MAVTVAEAMVAALAVVPVVAMAAAPVAPVVALRVVMTAVRLVHLVVALMMGHPVRMTELPERLAASLMMAPLVRPERATHRRISANLQLT